MHHVIGVCHRDIKPQNLLVHVFTFWALFYIFVVTWKLSEPFQSIVNFIQDEVAFFDFQVNPHTHQLKICDFGSAKMLVSYCSLSVSLFI